MTVGGILGTLVVGLVVGALGRLAVPGRQPIGCLLTILIGIVGAVAGLAIAKAADITADWIVLLCQVGVASICVMVVAGVMHGRSPRPPM